MNPENPIVLPDYGNCNLGILSSIVKYYGARIPTKPIAALDAELDRRRSRNTVWFIMDGMGSRVLEKNLPAESWLLRRKRQDLTAVFPCTTTAVMTSFFSGVQPISHAWLGWTLYFSDWDMCIDMFPFRDTFTGEKLNYQTHNVLSFMETPRVFDKIDAATEKSVSIDLFLTQSARPRILELAENRYQLCGAMSELVGAVEAKCAEPGNHFIIAYWKSPDALIHPYGMTAPEVRSFLQETNDLFERTLPNLADATTFISADHGLTDMRRHFHIDREPGLTELMRSYPGGDPRCKAFYIKPGKKDLFAARFEALVPNDQYRLIDTDEAIANGLFGDTEIHPCAKGFLGDFLALGVGEWDLLYVPEGGKPAAEFIGHHAGLTAEEMLVPLILA